MIKELRILLWTLGALFIAAGMLLVVAPGDTSGLWAWSITERHTSLMVGAGILAVAMYVIQSLPHNNRRPDAVVGLIMVCCTMLIATMNHWDEFIQYRPATVLWLVVCFAGTITLPVMAREPQHVAASLTPGQEPLPRMWALWITIRGFLFASISVLWLFNAGPVSTFWPWSISAIDLQLFTIQPLLAGWGAFLLLRGNRNWSDHRLLLATGALLGIGEMFVLAIAFDGYDWKSPLGILLPLMYVEWILTPAVAFLTVLRFTAAGRPR